MTHQLNTEKNVAVAEGYYWLPIDENTPRGVKVQLLNTGGVAVYGIYTEAHKGAFTHWAPLPRRRTDG